MREESGYDVWVSLFDTRPDAKTGAQLLCEARIQHRRLAALPASVRPQSTQEAYDCQADVVRQLLAHYGGRPVGYKIACTNTLAQRQLGVTGPFHGRLLSPFCFDSPASLPAAPFFMRVIEAEFAFQMGRDLPPGSYSREQIAASIAGLLPAIEIVDSRFESWTTIGVLSLISDNACNGAWVKGKLMEDWQHLDLAAAGVRLMVNGEVNQTGNGAAVLGHPLNALEWLVSALAESKQGLKAGDFVSTGVTTGVYMAEAGDRIAAEFDGAGSVQVEFT